MERFIRPLGGLVTVLVVLFSCASPVGESAAAIAESEALTAGNRGLDLMLPFPAGDRRTLTRAYLREEDVCFPAEERTTSHCTYAGGLWDDRYALDFSGGGCESWRAPVLATAEGRVFIPPDPRGSRVRSYGSAEIAIDHGNGCVSHYAHLDSRAVSDGQFVRQGEVIGFEGNRGGVQGTACPAHPGTHLHFKVVCDGVAVRPEPLSGYRNLHAHVYRWFAHRALHHPVGTLVKTRNDPRIYQVCGPDRLCHVADEGVWRSRRFWQDSRDEWATVIIVDDDEIACHDLGPQIASRARLAATTCGDATYVTFDGDGMRWRRRVPFDPTQAGYRILLRSWGFRPDEVVREDASCTIPQDSDRDRLSLRDGTVIEQASDDDFYVVADDGTAYRLYRNLMPVLYGGGWPQVIQVPDGSVPSLVRTVNHGHAEFTVTDATTCPNGRITLAPASGGATGGGTDGLDHEEDAANPSSPPVAEPMAGAPAPSPEPEPLPASDDSNPEGCDPGPDSTDPVPSGPPSVAAEPRTIVCARTGSAVTVTITGPVSDALVGGPPSQPVAIKYGSDKDGWTDFGYGPGSPKDQESWRGDIATYVLTLPADAGRCNFYLLGADGSVGWFDLPDADGDGVAWTVQGDCRMICAPDSCALSF